jgi:hypothetical protein
MRLISRYKSLSGGIGLDSDGIGLYISNTKQYRSYIYINKNPYIELFAKIVFYYAALHFIDGNKEYKICIYDISWFYVSKCINHHMKFDIWISLDVISELCG